MSDEDTHVDGQAAPEDNQTQAELQAEPGVVAEGAGRPVEKEKGPFTAASYGELLGEAVNSEADSFITDLASELSPEELAKVVDHHDDDGLDNE